MSTRSSAARRGHVKRRLRRNERLTGELLTLALETIGVSEGPTGDSLRDGMARKLMEGEPLDDYELHLLVDIYLDLP